MSFFIIVGSLEAAAVVRGSDGVKAMVRQAASGRLGTLAMESSEASPVFVSSTSMIIGDVCVPSPTREAIWKEKQ
jgi:hypothetical protein